MNAGNRNAMTALQDAIAELRAERESIELAMANCERGTREIAGGDRGT